GTAPSGDAQMGIQPVTSWDADAARHRGGASLARQIISSYVGASGGEPDRQGAGRLRAQARRVGGGSRVLPAASAHVLQRIEVRGAREASFGNPLDGAED